MRALALSRRTMRTAVIVCGAGIAVGLSPSVAVAGSYPISAERAIADLNAQRVENGIPGDLLNVPQLSLGCWQYENVYHYDILQYPHEELSSQPGYTALGNMAASMSDLASEGTPWGKGTYQNPWAAAPLHLVSLFDPTAHYAWFGAVQSPHWSLYGECMGTATFDPFAQGETASSAPTTPTFYSLPGNEAPNVAPAELPNEGPFSPQQAAHISPTHVTGPDILLFAVGAPGPQLVGASLYDARGSQVGLVVVSPSTPAPKPPPGWPKVTFVGAYTGNTWFVIPRNPLAGRARYKLIAQWSASGGYAHTEVVMFDTSCSTLIEALIEPPKIRGCRVGHRTS